MSISPASGWGWPGTSRAMKIAPAQVPHTVMPSATRSLSFGMKPYCAASLPIVVLSPPGMTSASMSSSCSGRRTSMASVPMRWKVSRCSRKSPCRPRTPARAKRSPTADGKAFARGERLEGDAAHRLTEAARDLGDELRVHEVRRRLDDRLRAAKLVLRILGRFEDAAAHEVPLGAELHHQRRVGRRRDPAGAEQHDRELLRLRDVAHEVERDAELSGLLAQLRFVETGERFDARRDLADVANGLDDVAGAGLALAADHRRAFVDPAERLAEITRAAYERHVELLLVDVVLLVRRREDLALVDVVDADGLEDLRLDEVADAGLRHHRDRDRVHDLGDELRVAHPRDAALLADVGRNPL